MSQDLTVNIRTTSDVPQAMDKSKTAVVSFSKQVEDVQKKFSTGIKDIFLGFFAPMVLFQNALSMIQDNLRETRELAKEGVNLISEGKGKGQTSNEMTLANIVKAKQELDKLKAETEAGKSFLLNWFASNTEEGKTMAKAIAENMISPEGAPDALERFGGYEGLLKRYLESPEGRKAQELSQSMTKEEEKKADGKFKGPEGFGTVVGVGANPVMEAMTRQNEILEEIKIILQEQSIQNRTGEGVPLPFTDRAVPLTMMKEGLA
jgi:hypothetical protein